jgi:ATP-dependent Lon protease
MRSVFPDQFQLHHKKVKHIDEEDIEHIQLPKKVEIPEVTNEELMISAQPVEDDESDETELKEKTIYIKEGESGYSYNKLFASYLKNARKIVLIDPYIRLEFQVRNLLSFVGMIDTFDGPVDFHLITSAEDDDQMQSNALKFKEIQENLTEHGINFDYSFDNMVHNRSITLDNGWKILLDRGLDIYQKPESWYQLSEVDQSKRKCRETEITYLLKKA